MLTKQNESLQRRFWSKVEKTDGCWNWTGATLPRKTGGHGQIGFQRRVIGVHRISAMLHHLLTPDNVEFTLDSHFHILHTCNNPRCVNPAHLYAGTHKQNMEDLARAGNRRLPRGDQHHGTKVTNQQVQEIRKLRQSGITRRIVAEQFGISITHVTRICNNKARL